MFDINFLSGFVERHLIFTSEDTATAIIVSAIAVYLVIILYTRMFGLRCLSKMSSFDFATTIATGTLLSSTIISKEATVMHGALALLVLYFLQFIVSVLRIKFKVFKSTVDNSPMLIMNGNEILHENLKKVQLTTADLHSHLRQSGVVNYNDVIAVVFETTGDVSVIKSSQDEKQKFDPSLLEGVVGAESVKI